MIYFALWPMHINPNFPSFDLWQLATYSFLHGSVTHLFFNMFALYIFGQRLESLFGTAWFLKYYFACVITAAMTHLLFMFFSGENLMRPTVGASGGVFGLLLAYAKFFPDSRLMLLFPPIPIKAKHFVILYGCLELFLGITGSVRGIAHFAHLGGMVGGYLMLRGR